MTLDTTITLRLNSSLKEKFVAIARSKGLSASQYLLKAVLEEVARECPDEEILAARERSRNLTSLLTSIEQAWD